MFGIVNTTLYSTRQLFVFTAATTNSIQKNSVTG